jgi:glutaredoxin
MGRVDVSSGIARVTLYTREGCGLCDEALAGLRAMLDEGSRFELEEVDIERDDDTLRKFLERIPVIEVDGEIVCELWLDRAAVLARVDTVSRMERSADRASDR